MAYPTVKPMVDRDGQRKIIQELLKPPSVQKPFEAAEFFGIGGVGKSCILEEAKEQCRQQQVLFLVDNFSAETASASHPELDFLYRVCDFVDPVTNFIKGRSSLDAVRTGAARPESPAGLYGQDVLGEYYDQLSQALRGQRWVIMLDRVEYCPDELFNWLGREFLAPLIGRGLIGGIILFLGSRAPRISDSRWPAVLKGAARLIRLDPLDFDRTCEHVALLSSGGRDYGEAAREIYTLSNGHPYSTEAIVYWLGSLGVDVLQVSGQRSEMTRRLREEVIRRYILADAGEWVLPFLEIACHFRWFTSGFLAQYIQKYRPELAGDQVGWYITRLRELEKPPLHLIYRTSDHYELEPTLRRLLQIGMAVLEPDTSRAIHRDAIQRREEQLQKEYGEPQSGRLSDNTVAKIVIEILHHAAQLSVIDQRDPQIQEELERILSGYFDPRRTRDLELLSFLREELERDSDLSALSGEKLPEIVDRFLAIAPPQFQLSHLVIEHEPPSDYRVSWYQAGQQVVPTERVGSERNYDIADWLSRTEEVGQAAFAAYLPIRTQEFIGTRRDWAILLTTNKPEVPWELLHDGKEFLCLSRPMGRRPAQWFEPEVPPKRKPGPARALVIGDPNDNLPAAKKEAVAIADLLKKKGVEVRLWLGKDAKASEFSMHIPASDYDLIHFAGHAYFDADIPRRSGLVFADGRMLADELGRYLRKKRAFIFLNACYGGMAKTDYNQAGGIGDFINGLAASVLLRGSVGCLAPLAKVADAPAGDFALAFYKRLLKHDCLGEAVRQARLESLKGADPGSIWKVMALYADPLQKSPLDIANGTGARGGNV